MGDWRKSSYSTGDGGNCVEAASGNGTVQVRDTADRGGPAIRVAATAWQRFAVGLKVGTFTPAPAP